VSEVYAGLQATIYRSIALMVAGVLFSVLAAMWLAGTMVRPIRTLQEGAQRIGAGDLDTLITVGTGDELQELAEQFNRMTAQLSESYAGLERKVEERTNELQETLEQQTAISEILRVISSSPGDVKPVLDAVAARATRLCDAAAATIYVLEGDVLRRTAFYGPEGLLGGDTLPYSADTLTGRTIAEGKPIHVVDIEQEQKNFPKSWEFAQKFGRHTMLSVPLTREGKPFGTMFLRRAEVRPFTEKQIGLSRTFADQAAIAIENVRLFKEIQEKSAQLEIANKHKSDFLANMSHELRTPLNAIIGFSEVLIERMFGEMNEKQADYLKDIHESGKHLLSLINDILDLSKIEAGRMDLEVSSFHLPSALSNAMTLVRERAQRHGIALDLQVDKRLAEFNADERKFKQILLNLLSNAVKFTPDGGRVDVTAKLNGKAVEVAVRDTGIGIAPDDQQKIFSEFVQVGRDYTRKAEGTGLGLALTKRFVELHGGEIRLESAPGKGSTFTFTIPIRS
jgi:signal transduction histidine kinase